jgi:uncharacterized RDD family membrane protein YckC
MTSLLARIVAPGTWPAAAVIAGTLFLVSVTPAHAQEQVPEEPVAAPELVQPAPLPTTPPTPAVEAVPAAPAVDSVAPSEPVPAPTPPPPPPPLVNRREVVTIGSNSHLRANETAQEMVTIMGNAIVDGRVRGESVTIMGNVTVNGRVDGELVCIMGRVTLGPQAEVRGQIVTVGGNIDAAPGAVMLGERVEIPFFGGMAFPSFEWLGEWFSEGLMLGRPLPHRQSWAWTLAGVLLLINILFFALFRRPVEAGASVIDRRPAMAFLNGILVILFFLPVVLLLMASVVGLLIVPFAFAGLFLAGFAGLVAVYRFCGGQLGLGAQPLLALIVGQVLFTLLYFVPFVGFAVLSVACVLGLGAEVTAMIESMRSEARADRRKPGGGSPGTAPSASFAPTPVPHAPPPAPLVMRAAPAAPSMPGSVPEVPDESPASAASGFVAAGSAASETPVAPPPPPAPPPPQVVSHGPAIRPLPPLDQLERVGFWPRLGATAIDFLIIAPLSLWLSSLLWWLPGDTPAFPVLWLGYHAGFWAWKSTTIGGHVLNLRVVRLDRGHMDAGLGIVRALGSILSFMPLGLGFIWASWDEQRQSWHDKIAGTTVVRVPPGQSLF